MLECVKYARNRNEMMQVVLRDVSGNDRKGMDSVGAGTVETRLTAAG